MLHLVGVRRMFPLRCGICLGPLPGAGYVHSLLRIQLQIPLRRHGIGGTQMFRTPRGTDESYIVTPKDVSGQADAFQRDLVGRDNLRPRL